MSRKVSIIGAGNVGTATLFTLALSGTAEEIVLLDRNLGKAQGEVLDIEHGSSFLPTVQLKAAKSYKDIANSDVVVITAGAKQAAGETRLDLLQRNAAIIKSIVLDIKKYAPNTILLIVANPVDVLTYLAYRYSGFSKQRVIGSGTVLDTARFRAYLGKHFKINPHNVHAYILGEHGDSSFPVLSTADIGSVPLAKLPGYNEKRIQEIHHTVIQAAYQVIQKKGATNSAIAICVNQLVRAILNNTHEVFSISSVLKGEYDLRDVSLNTPSVLGRKGIEHELILPLNAKEKAALHKSAVVLKRAIASVRRTK